MAESPPSFLTPELMAKVVGRPVRQVDAKPISSGDNFASSTIRATVTTDQGDVHHIIVKKPLPPGTEDQFYPIRETFAVEGRIYEKVKPRMEEMLKTVSADIPPLGPRMLYQQPEPEPLIILEDISVEGFRLANREENLDEDHVRLALCALARWHASSTILLLEKPELFKDLPRMVCEEHAQFVDGMLVKGFRRFLKHAEQWPEEVSKRVVAKLKRLEPDCRKRIMDANKPDPMGFNVGLHGDFWTGNLLFKYDDDGKKPVDIRLIDYQISSWGSPACDLLYFFPTASGEVRAKFHELLAEYHAELSTCLKALGAKQVPDLETLKADLRRRGINEVMHFLSSVPIIMAPHSMAVSFETLMDIHNGEGPHLRDICIEREPFQRVAKEYFAAWDREGLLDALLEQHV